MSETDEVIAIRNSGGVAIIDRSPQEEASNGSLTPPASFVYPIKPVPALHISGNGLLSATRIAEFFELSWEELAQSLSVSPEVLRQNAVATPIQLRLLGFERIAAALLFLAGNKENADVWLSLPEAQISNQTPLSFIKAGHGHIIAEMLEDIIWGQPS